MRNSEKQELEENIKNIAKMSDQEVLYAEHDTLVDITHDISGSLYLHKYHDALEKEIENRKLSKLPRLNGTMSF